MENPTKNIILNSIGIFFILISLSAIINSYFHNGFSQILWMCYISTFIIGIGIIKRKSNIILSQFYLLAIPLLIWNIDFFYHLITSNSLWGITDYFFTGTFNFGNFISLQHIYSIPLSLFAVKLIKINLKKSLKISFIQLFLIYIITHLISNPSANANCIYSPCFNFPFQISLYPLAWFFTYSLMILLAYYPVNRLYKKINSAKSF